MSLFFGLLWLAVLARVGWQLWQYRCPKCHKFAVERLAQPCEYSTHDWDEWRCAKCGHSLWREQPGWDFETWDFMDNRPPKSVAGWVGTVFKRGGPGVTGSQ